MEKNPVYELSSGEYNLKLAEALKNIPGFKKPEWVEFVKSGPSKSRPIDNQDFWHKRAASILRFIYINKTERINIKTLLSYATACGIYILDGKLEYIRIEIILLICAKIHKLDNFFGSAVI